MLWGHRANSKSSEHSKRVTVLGLKDGSHPSRWRTLMVVSLKLILLVNPDIYCRWTYGSEYGSTVWSSFRWCNFILCFELAWGDSWHSIFESLGNSPPCVFFTFAIKPQVFFIWKIYFTSQHLSFLLSLWDKYQSSCRKKQSNGSAGTNIGHHPGTTNPRSSSLAKPWVLLGLVWGTC